MSFAQGMYKFWDYETDFFVKYCIYDENGDLIEVKNDAPDDFKKAFEEYRSEEEKIREEAKSQNYLIS